MWNSDISCSWAYKTKDNNLASAGFFLGEIEKRRRKNKEKAVFYFLSLSLVAIRDIIVQATMYGFFYFDN